MSKQAAHFWFEWILSSLEEGKEVALTAKGWSMWPTVKPGSELKLKKIPVEEIEVGDAIAFIRGEHFVVHRVEKIAQENPRKIITRGDANLRFDEMVSIENYCGKVLHPTLNPAPQITQRLFAYLFQLFEINWVRAKKIPSLLKRDSEF